MKLAIINGPNLNLLGTRETETYGTQSFEDFFEALKVDYPNVQLSYFQSNVEGELIDYLQQAQEDHDGAIFNGAGYTHTSVAIADAIAAIAIPVVEVHISNIHAREEFRYTSLTGRNCAGVITGFGLDSYRLAVEWFLTKK